MCDISNWSSQVCLVAGLGSFGNFGIVALAPALHKSYAMKVNVLKEVVRAIYQIHSKWETANGRRGS